MRFLSWIVVIYMLAAFVWWGLLIDSKSNTIHELKMELSNYDQSIDREAVDIEYDRQRKMVVGEGFVFGAALVIGLILIYRSLYRELLLARNHKNFLLSITHELKSPLSSIKLALGTIRTRNLNQENVIKVTKIAEKEASRLQKLVENILTATSLETVYKPNLELTSLNEIRLKVKQIVLGQQERINFKLNDDFTSFYIDFDGFIMVLDNIIDNSIKYSNDEVFVEFSKQKEFIYCVIKDTGIGIPDEEKPKVFKRFYRVGSEETRSKKGTGLGMYIVKKILSVNRGTIMLKDNQPKGLITEIKMPIYEKSAIS